MSRLSEHAAAIAQQAREKETQIGPTRDYVTRREWTITTPLGKVVDVLITPPATLAEMQRIYTGCTIEPGEGACSR